MTKIPEITFLICSNRAQGSLRKALEAVALQPHRESWECLLVDNGFDDQSAANLQKLAILLFPGGNFKMVREPVPGLGYARKRGFEEAQGFWVAMLDDDNYLDANFMAEIIKLFIQFPDVGGVGPCVYPLLPQPVTEGFRLIAHRCLSVTEDVLASLGEMPRYYPAEMARQAPRPPGGGMIVLREAGLAWAADAERCGTLFLARTGSRLMGAEDHEIWSKLLSLGVPVVLSDRLRIAHDLPASRFKGRYLWRLNYWMAWSYAWLDCSESGITAPASPLAAAVQSLRHLKLIIGAKTHTERLDRWMDWASFLGTQAARRTFRSSGPRRDGKGAISLADETAMQPITKSHEH